MVDFKMLYETHTATVRICHNLLTVARLAIYPLLKELICVPVRVLLSAELNIPTVL